MSTRVTPGLYAGSLLATVLIALAMSSLPSDAKADSGEVAVRTQVFDIFRNGDPVGTHEVRKEFAQDATKIQVNSNIALHFLGFTVFRFEYSAEEVWDDRGLRQLNVSVDNNGKKSNFDGKRKGQAFEWNTGEKRAKHILPLYPTNHWNAAVLEQEKVLNTLTGEVDAVSITKLGRELLRLSGSSVAATRYRYDGELALDSWYDDQGRWVAMRFQGEDGSTIEYLCRDCQSGTLM